MAPREANLHYCDGMGPPRRIADSTVAAGSSPLHRGPKNHCREWRSVQKVHEQNGLEFCSYL